MSSTAATRRSTAPIPTLIWTGPVPDTVIDKYDRRQIGGLFRTLVATGLARPAFTESAGVSLMESAPVTTFTEPADTGTLTEP